MTAGMNPRSLRTAETGTRRYARGEGFGDSDEKCLTSQAPGDGKAGRFATRTDIAVNRAAVNVPVIPEPKCVAYRLWFVTVIFLEYGLTKKHVAWRYANGAHDDDWLWSRFALQTQWLNVTLHALIDLTTLFYLNALHPRWGVQRPSDGDGAAELLVPASVPLLARHMLKLTLRIPPLNSCILGAKWGCHHAFTTKQALAITLSPSYIEIMLNRFSFGGLVLMGLVNSVFMVSLSFSNSYTYMCHEEQRARFLQQIGGEYDESKFRMGRPIVFLAPFLFDEVHRWPSVSRGVWAWIRLSNRLFFGVRERSVSGITPSSAGAFARRLRTSASIVVHVVAALLAAVSMANGAPVLLVIAAAWAQTSVPRFVFARLSASARWCYALRASTNGTAAAAARWTVSFAFACTAAATTVAARMWSTGANFDAASSSRTWAAAFAAVGGGDARVHTGSRRVRGERRGGAGCGGVRRWASVIDPTGGFGRVRREASARRELRVRAAPERLGDVRAASGGAETRRWCTKKRVVVREGRAANDHWRLEDFVIDPVRFELRAAKDAQFEDRHRFKPMAYDASMNDPPRVIEKLTCRAKNCCREVDEQNLMAASVALCPEHFTSKKPFEYGSLTCAALFCLMCRRVHVPPLCRECMLFSDREGAKVMIKSRRTPCAREEIRQEMTCS